MTTAMTLTRPRTRTAARPVDFRRLMTGRERRAAVPLMIVAFSPSLMLLTGLFQLIPSPLAMPDPGYPGPLGNGAGYVAVAVVLMVLGAESTQLLALIGLAWSTWISRDPVPAKPEPNLRIAFVTTIVPAAEPLDMVRMTLASARRVTYSGTLDVWLLDEGDDPRVRQMCQELGVHHFSRAGIARWNQPSGPFRARTKHGNHNAWLDAHGDAYSVVMSVDPDHVPRPDFAEKMLGYFRDPDVAFVVGPQVYGNRDSFIAKGAEAQISLFQAVVQRAGNRFGCSMLVGTNNAFRTSAWRQIGGFRDSITEDLATSIAVHGAHNPSTGQRWKSVYVPDIVAVGEGPATWTDLFNQQLRWARGANDVLVRGAPGRLAKLNWGQRVYYSILFSHYPLTGIRWILGAAFALAFPLLGSSAFKPHSTGALLVLCAAVACTRPLLYLVLRRYSVRPEERTAGSFLSGTLLSMFCLPLYSAALVGALLRRPLGFVVTKKGESSSPDGAATFRRHIRWALFLAVSSSGVAFLPDYSMGNAALAVACLAVCVLPIALWRLASPKTHGLQRQPAAELFR